MEMILASYKYAARDEEEIMNLEKKLNDSCICFSSNKDFDLTLYRA